MGRQALACLLGLALAAASAYFFASKKQRAVARGWARAALPALAIAVVAAVIAAVAWRYAAIVVARHALRGGGPHAIVGDGSEGDGGADGQEGGGGKCSAASAQAAKMCGAEDPVSDPDYNMKEIAKQSILLEEHLVEKNKRCKDCIAKHFLHIIGLAEEAQCLAGSKLAKYPLMGDSPKYYKRLFDRWLKHRDNDAEYRKIDDQLRARRKQLMAVYVLGDDHSMAATDTH